MNGHLITEKGHDRRVGVAGSHVKTGVAVIGAGLIGGVHMRHLVRNPRLTIKWIVDLDEQTGNDAMVAGHLNADTCAVTTFDNMEQVFSDPSVDMVMICTPTHTHTKIILSALKKGKAVFCEKPISENVAEIEEVYRMAESVKKPLLCGYHRRFDMSNQKLRECVKSGKLGTIQSIRNVFRDYPGAPVNYIKTIAENIDGVTIFHDLGLHEIDILLWLMNEELPETVYSVGTVTDPTLQAMGQIDTAISTLQFASGPVAVIESAYRSGYGYDIRTEVTGTKSMAIAGNPSETSISLFTPDNNLTDKMPYSFPARYMQAYSSEIDHLIDVIQGKAELAISGSHCVKVAKVADAMKQSFTENRTIKLV